MHHRMGIAAIALALGVLGTLLIAPPASASPTHVGVPSPRDGREIWISIYRPEGAGPSNKVPVILHSHGWGGTRTSTDGAFAAWLEAGFGVVSIDQRGHGATGGISHVQNPAYEARDIIGVIDHVASLDWVAKDRDVHGNEKPNDPVLGAIGGSYGGGYQLMTALTEVSKSGRTRFNALAPEITWNDLPRSLAPQDVPRTLWDTTLYAAGARMLPRYVHESYALGVATATFPNGEIPNTYNLKERFHANSPAWFAERGVLLDIPVLFRQGTTDNLFPLNEAYHNYTGILTDQARGRSLMIGYNGGHALPSVVPPGTAAGSDACSGEGGFGALSREFFVRAFAGQDTASLMPTPYSITSVTGTECFRVSSLAPNSQLAFGETLSTVADGGPVSHELAQGPLTVVGIPRLSGKITSPLPEVRVFFALSMGTSPATAQVIQHNVMPLRQRLPASNEDFELELAGIAAAVPEGQNLYLTVSPVSDMFAGMSRTPGVIQLSQLLLDLPLA